MLWEIAFTVGAAGLALFFVKKMVCDGKCYETGRLDGKVIIVTGASAGIGQVTAAELARRGAKVIMACRNNDKAEDAKSAIIESYGEHSAKALTKDVVNDEVKAILTPVKESQLVIEKLDLGSMESIREFATRVSAKEPKIDILINNAGVMMCPYGKTKDGFELQMGTNHLGHFLLTELLLPSIKKAGPGSRIICLSSVAHKRAKKLDVLPLNTPEEKYNRLECYARSKLANVMHAHYLAKRLEKDGILTASVHPGVVRTELYRHIKFFGPVMDYMIRPFMKNSWEGAQTTLFTVLTPNLVSGAYYADCAIKEPLAKAFDEKAGEDLVAASREAVNLPK